MYMIITDLFDIDIHIFIVIKVLFNLVVKFKYIYRKERRNSVRESENEKRNDSVFTDEEEDSWLSFAYKISSTIKKINLRFAYTFITFGINIHVVYIVTSNTLSLPETSIHN